jgi:hypothetical protein
MGDFTLSQLIASPEFPLPADSAPARFTRLLAEVVPGWRVEPPDEQAVDMHFAAITPDDTRRSVAVTVDWPPAAGYRDIDEWTVHGYGPHRVGMELQLCHDAGREEFAVALRLLRTAWEDVRSGSAGPKRKEEGLVEVKGMQVNLDGADWKKSSRSGAAGHCVEVAVVGQATAVRDSKDPSGPALVFTGDEWDAFLGGAKAGEFDRS